MGEMTGLGQEVAEWEDLVFTVSEADALLVVTGDDDHHLYGVDPLTGAIRGDRR